jgi:hypothetical protein
MSDQHISSNMAGVEEEKFDEFSFKDSEGHEDHAEGVGVFISKIEDFR